MKYFTYLLTGLLLCVTAATLSAQKLTLSDVEKAYTAGSGAIADESGAVTGYYFLYRDGRKGRSKGGERMFTLKFTDANLELKQSKRISVDRTTVALGAAYNGQAVCLAMWNPRDRELSFKSYDVNGERLGSKTVELSNKELRYFMTMEGLTDDDATASFLHAVPGVGFVTHLPKIDKSNGWEVTLYDAALEKQWAKQSNPTLGKYQMASFLAAGPEYVFTSTLERTKMLSNKDIRARLYAHDVATGKEVFELDLTRARPVMTPTNAFYDPEAGVVTVAGMYYGRDADPIKDKSEGLAVKRVGLDGEVIDKGTVTWARVFGKIGRTKTEHLKKGGSIYVHRVMSGATGNLSIIGEYYDKDVSALGIASQVLSGGRGGASTSSIFVQDVLVVELDAALALADAHLFAKPKREVNLPAGMGMASAGMLATYIKATGGYDYAYTQAYPDAEGYLMAYTSRRKKERGMGREDYLNFVAYDPATGKYDETDFKLETDATSIAFRQGKPGYIMVSEYDRKAKTLNQRLERID